MLAESLLYTLTFLFNTPFTLFVQRAHTSAVKHRGLVSPHITYQLL